MSILTIDRILCDATDSAIAWYQRAISPRKGFACAYRIRNDGESCSQFARRVFRAGGWWSGLCAVIARFRDCGEAARVLRRLRETSRAHRVRDEYFDAAPAGEKAAIPGNAGDASCDPTALDAAWCCFEACCSSFPGPP